MPMYSYIIPDRCKLAIRLFIRLFFFRILSEDTRVFCPPDVVNTLLQSNLYSQSTWELPTTLPPSQLSGMSEVKDDEDWGASGLGGVSLSLSPS